MNISLSRSSSSGAGHHNSYSNSIITGSPSSDIYTAGDSLANGIATYLRDQLHVSSLSANAKDGLASNDILNRISNDPNSTRSKTAVISVGTNDSNGTVLAKNLEKIRETLKSKGVENIVWVIPYKNNKDTVLNFAKNHGDKYLNVNSSNDGLHPATGYAALAKEAKSIASSSTIARAPMVSTPASPVTQALSPLIAPQITTTGNWGSLEPTASTNWVPINYASNYANNDVTNFPFNSSFFPMANTNWYPDATFDPDFYAAILTMFQNPYPNLNLGYSIV